MEMNMDTYNNVKQKLEGEHSSFFSALDGFKTAYVNHEVYPDDEEYDLEYFLLLNNLKSIKKELDDIKSEQEQILENNEKELEELNVYIKEQKDENKHYRKELNNLNMLDNGSKVLKYDTELHYNKQYMQNVIMVIGNVLLTGATYSLFKN